MQSVRKTVLCFTPVACMAAVSLSVACLSVVTLMTGCAGDQTTGHGLAEGVGASGELAGADGPGADVLRDLPLDFTLELWAVTSRGPKDRRPEMTDQPLRFIVFPDGALHFAFRPDAYLDGAQWLPDRTRQLDRRELGELWSLIRRLGLTDVSVHEPPRNMTLLKAPSDGILHAMNVTAHGSRWSLVRSQSGAAQPDPTFDVLLEHLGALAWADLRDPAVERGVTIQRYDYGPDPYARYRTAGEQ